MNAKRIRDEGQTLALPRGKILGIVDSREQFEAVVVALKSAGFDKIEVLIGEEGVSLLKRVEGFFFSDMESRVLARHIDELERGHVIIAIEAPTDRVDEAVDVASEHGARRLVHFGNWTITWHTK